MLLLFVVLLFIFPVSVYLAVLSGLNHRERPTLIPGVWDYVGLLFGLSGFLFIAGPSILYLIYLRSMPGLFARGTEQPLFDFFLWSWTHFGLVGYFGVFFLLVSYALYARRRATVLYNIRPDAFDQLLSAVFANRGLDWDRWGNQVRFGPDAKGTTKSDTPISGNEHVTAEATIPQQSPSRPVVMSNVSRWYQITVDAFPLFWNVTIWWNDVPHSLRLELERDIQHRLQSVPQAANPSAGWLLTASGTLFGVIIVCVVGLVLYTFFAGS